MAVRGRTAIFPHQIDKTTDCNSNLDIEHDKVHSGNCYYHTYVAEVDAASTMDRFVITPNTTRWAHLFWTIESQGLITADFSEAATGATRAVTSYNRNRNYAATNTTGVHEPNDEAAVAGTIIWSWTEGTTGPTRGRTPGLIRSSGELVLKQNTKYLMQITSGVNDNNISLYLTWYEHTNIE